MPINIRLKTGFVYFGESAGQTDFEVPYPSNAPFQTEYIMQTQTSSDGSTAAQLVGRSRSTQQMEWERMDCALWWALCTWIEANGPSFYVRYFDFNRGIWRTRRFYVAKISGTPVRPNKTTGEPLYMADCSMTINDMGVPE